MGWRPFSMKGIGDMTERIDSIREKYEHGDKSDCGG